MLQTIRNILAGIIDDIDAGNSNIDEGEAVQIAKALRTYTRKDAPMSKYQAFKFLGISRATFDNRVRAGQIPRGRKVQGFRELRWYKKDLLPLKRK